MKQMSNERDVHIRAGSRRRGKRARDRRMLILLTAILLVAGLSAAAALMIKGNAEKNGIVGRWDVDGTTQYQFSADGTGAMLLPSVTYDFTYELEGDCLRFDFRDDKLRDGIYTFEVKGDTLILTGRENTIGGVYELHRLEE